MLGMGAQVGHSQPHRLSEGRPSRSYENYVSQGAQGICFCTLKTKDAAPHPTNPWSLSGVYCLEGVPGKWGEVAGGGRKPLQMPGLPPTVFIKLSPPVQIPPCPPTPDPCWENRLMAKWSQSQTKHAECSQAPQTAGTKGLSLL